MLNVEKFVKKSFPVDAIRVTSENMEEVAKWCRGDIRTANTDDPSGSRYIRVRVYRPLGDRQTKAFVGDWVLYAGTGYKVYTPGAFEKSFERAPEQGEDVPARQTVPLTGDSLG